MDKVVLKAEKRNVTGKQVNSLRRAGKLPAVIYGRHLEPIAISLDAHSTGLTMNKLTSSSLVTISLDGREFPALVRDRQRDYIKGGLTHIDFLAVNLDEKIRATISLEFVGVSLAVKDFNAVLVKNLEKLEVECLPTDLPERVKIDIAVLRQIGDGIRVRDVNLSDKVSILTDDDEMIVVATAPKVEAATAETPEGAEVVGEAEEAAEPEMSVERGKKDEDEE